MSIDRGDFDSLSEADLQELVAGQVPEGLRLDYKLTSYGPSDAEKREFLKDVSALANSQGGHLVLGMQENAGVAAAIVGIAGLDPDAEILRLEQIARAGLEPRVSGLRMKAVPLASRNQVLVIRMPRSWNPPHRVVAQGANRFYVRHSAGVHEASVEELRALFTQSASNLQQARQFRDERLRFIQEDSSSRPLVHGGRLIIHIVPVAAFSGGSPVDPQAAYAKHQALHPIGGTEGTNPGYNYFGFINERGGQRNHGYTQVFRNGILEATKAPIMRQYNGRDVIGARDLERQIFAELSSYVNTLRDIGVPPPLVVLFTLLEVQAAYYVEKLEWEEYGAPLPQSLLTLPECVVEDYGSDRDYHKAVRPAFDALWNSIGRPRAPFFNADGQWAG